ncbi:Glutaredoxin 4 [bacterium HR30]|nr:Glutaredoxin 4 [bacterium HR30]
MSRNVFAEIEKEIRENKVIIYMKGNPQFPMCGFSAAAVECLKQYGYPFAHVDVLEDPEKREAIKQFSNWPTIPQIYIDGQFIGGCDIIRELHATGELRSLLDRAFGKGAEVQEKG